MKKVLIPFDGTHVSYGALEFARRLNDTEPILLVGIFLPQIIYPGNYAFTGTGVMEIPVLAPMLEENIEEVVETNILYFKELCGKYGIEHRVHEASHEFALPQLRKETRYADLVVVGSQLFYDNNQEDNVQGEYLASFLHHSECPVLLVPEQFEFPDNNIIAFDGTESCVFAIKQFVYIMQAFCGQNTTLIYADTKGEGSIPDEVYIEELASRHFSNPELCCLALDPAKYFETFLMNRKSALLITGAYDRNMVSRLFTRSFAEDVIRDYQTPVFIAHR